MNIYILTSYNHDSTRIVSCHLTSEDAEFAQQVMQRKIDASEEYFAGCIEWDEDDPRWSDCPDLYTETALRIETHTIDLPNNAEREQAAEHIRSMIDDDRYQRTATVNLGGRLQTLRTAQAALMAMPALATIDRLQAEKDSAEAETSRIHDMAGKEIAALKAEVERLREAMRVAKHKLVQARMEERADHIKEMIGHAEYSLSEVQP